MYDPTLDSHARAIKTDDGEYIYIEAELPVEGERVRVTIEALPVERSTMTFEEGMRVTRDARRGEPL